MAASGQPAASPVGEVSPAPASGTPALAANGSVEIVRKMVQCGGTMYAVGTFTSIKKGSTTYSRNNIFSFSATAPYTVNSWDPNVNGVVNSIAFTGTSCANAYIGGKFTSVGGTAVKNIAEISTSTSTGAVVTAFGHSASAQVETLQYYNGHILAGGYFTSINNSTANKYMASLNPTTGKDDGFIHLSISGQYVPGGGTRIYNQQLSHGGTLDLVEGDFTSVGGLQRQQIFMLDLSKSPAVVTGWTSPEFDGSQYQCVPNEAFYLQAAAWSPDDSAVYVATTGYHPNGVGTGSTPRSGLCDAAAAFPATKAPVQHSWINYTGCDSLFSVAADKTNVYVGGHERWTMNPNGCDFAGPGAEAEAGMEGLNPTLGPGGGAITSNPPVYTRGRGNGADDMMITSAGLWISSDNAQNTDSCGGVHGHSGICFLPY